MKKISLIFCLILLSFVRYSISQENLHKWDRFSGKWSISNSTAIETLGKKPSWNIYELINYNSIVSINPIDNLSSIDVNAKLFERLETPSEFMISFAVTSERQKWFYHIYAFKFSGGFWGIDKASFIYSDRLDKTKPINAKNNIFINELASANCKIKYDRMYNYRVAFEGTDVVLYINGEKILSSPFPEKSHDGHIAISSRNVKIAVDKVEVRKEKKIIFEDDFNEDSIYVRVIKATREPAPKNETVNKPEQK